MASAPTIHIICSNQEGSGKTLLARLVTDYLLLDGRDPFLFDADFPNGSLRWFFPGRTALVDFSQSAQRVELFRRMLNAPGRDYVIDLPATATGVFFRAATEQQFKAAAHAVGFRLVALFVLGAGADAMTWAATIEAQARLDLVVLAQNAMVRGPRANPPRRNHLEMPLLEPALVEIIANKRFSFRRFILGEDTAVPAPLKAGLNTFLFRVMTDLHNIRPEPH